MYKKVAGYMFSILLFNLFSIQDLMAQQVVLVREFATVTPIFMSGQEGNMEMIEGFELQGDILLDGNVVGTSSGRVLLLNPPVNLLERYDQGILTITNTFPGVGSFQVTAQFVSLGSSTSPSAGDGSFSWSGSISNGSGDLEDSFGLSAGIGSYNIFTGQASGTETIQLRSGF